MHRINIFKLSNQNVTQSSETQAFVSACSYKLGMELRVQYSMIGETQLYNIHLLCDTCTDAIKFVQMRGIKLCNLCREVDLVQMRGV